MDYRRWKRRMLSTVGRNAGPFAEMAVAGAAHVVEEALGMHPERTMRKARRGKP
jgi:hypothetical protein